MPELQTNPWLNVWAYLDHLKLISVCSWGWWWDQLSVRHMDYLEKGWNLKKLKRWNRIIVITMQIYKTVPPSITMKEVRSLIKVYWPHGRSRLDCLPLPNDLRPDSLAWVFIRPTNKKKIEMKTKQHYNLASRRSGHVCGNLCVLGVSSFFLQNIPSEYRRGVLCASMDFNM